MKSEDAAVIFSSLKQDDNLIVAEGNRPFLGATYTRDCPFTKICSSEQLRATHAINITHARNQQMQKPNKNAVESD